MKIKNINGVENTGCRCESRLHHWDRFSGQEPNYCPVEGCMNPIETAALVQREGPADGPWFIIPLCQKHDAKRGETLVVNDHVKWVSANVGETCGQNGE